MAGTLKDQVRAVQTSELMQRVGAALSRHAVYLKMAKVAPTAGEVLWATAVLGTGYDAMLLRAERYCSALPAFYNAADFTEASITDTAILTIVPDLPVALPPV